MSHTAKKVREESEGKEKLADIVNEVNISQQWRSTKEAQK